MERKGSQNSLDRKMNAYHDGKYIHTSVFGFVPFREFEKTQVVTRKTSLLDEVGFVPFQVWEDKSCDQKNFSIE